MLRRISHVHYHWIIIIIDLQNIAFPPTREISPKCRDVLHHKTRPAIREDYRESVTVSMEILGKCWLLVLQINIRNSTLFCRQNIKVELHKTDFRLSGIYFSRKADNVNAIYLLSKDGSFIILFYQAFTMIDANRDGFIDQEDLKDTYASLGESVVKNII